MKEHSCASAASSIKILGQLWQEMTDAQKKPYADLRDKDLLRFQKQTKEFSAKGYFTLEDGSKSTDQLPKVKGKLVKSSTKTTMLGKRPDEKRITISINIDDEEDKAQNEEKPANDLVSSILNSHEPAKSQNSGKARNGAPHQQQASSASSVNDPNPEVKKKNNKKRQKV
jgi:hypothetical protein